MIRYLLLTLFTLTFGGNAAAQVAIPRIVGPMVSGGGGGCSDTDASAWQSAVISAGGTVSGGRLTLVCNLITTLKSNGVWSKLDRIWLLAAENSKSALIDLKARGTASEGGTPTFTVDRGYTAWLNTAFNPSTGTPNYTQNSAHFAFWNRTNRAADTGVEMGDADATDSFSSNISLKWTDNNQYAALNDGNLDTGFTAPSPLNGFWVVNRTSSGSYTVYQNATSVRTGSQTSTRLPAFNYIIGGGLQSGNFVSNASSCEFAAATIGGGLTTTDITNLYNALSTYMTAVGA